MFVESPVGGKERTVFLAPLDAATALAALLAVPNASPTKLKRKKPAPPSGG